MFPVLSTSLETERIARAIKVLQRHAKVSALISRAAVYDCKQTSGTSLYSAHAFGDAVDLMADADNLEAIARCVIRDAVRLTADNHGMRTKVVFVIWGIRQWVADHGESAYTGVPHTSHVHVGCSFSTRVVPGCAGGRNYRVRYASGG